MVGPSSEMNTISLCLIFPRECHVFRMVFTVYPSAKSEK